MQDNGEVEPCVNPLESGAEVPFDDNFRHGPLQALRFSATRTGASPKGCLTDSGFYSDRGYLHISAPDTKAQLSKR